MFLFDEDAVLDFYYRIFHIILLRYTRSFYSNYADICIFEFLGSGEAPQIFGTLLKNHLKDVWASFVQMC